MIKVSVIVPIYNQPKLVVKALDSIPIRKDIEVIAVINGDNKEVRDEVYYNINNFNYKVLDFMDRLGCWGAMNKGVEEARGEYIYQLDEDDTLDTANFNKVIDEYLGADLVYVNLKINDGSIWHINDSNRSFMIDHTSLIKRSFMGDERFGEGSVDKIDGGLDLFNKLLQKEHTRTITDIVVYNYNHPRKDSLLEKANRKVKQ